VEQHPEYRETLMANAAYFRREIAARGFRVNEGIHPIVPIMLGDENVTVELARRLNDLGIFVVGFSYPVVPRGEARIRVQLSAAQSRGQIDRALDAFSEVGRHLGVIS
jgi:glycine C-acetyltransferase